MTTGNHCDESKRPFFDALLRYGRDERGIAAILFGLVAPVIVAAGGVAVDLGQAYHVKNRLGHALDKAALAVAATTGDQAALEERMNAFFDANYPADKLGTPYDVALTLNEQSITVSASAQVDTSFMRIFGIDHVTVSAFTEVTRELSGIEVVLVLDVTGSMAGTNIAALRTASTNFVNIMFDRVNDLDQIKIGMVPYAQTVNVGPYGWGRDEAGQPYGDGAFVVTPATDPFVNPPSNIVYHATQRYNWQGCILEPAYPEDTQDVEGPWQMYRWPDLSLSRPNNRCPVNFITPLTNNQTTLLSKISGLTTGGNTYGNIGMVWGYRVISPDPPFTEGVPFTDARWIKAVLMMTDGDNTMHNYYSGHGLTSEHGMTVTDLNERFEETCNNMKAEGILIYTVTFQSNINQTTRDYYRNCASQPGMYFNAPTDSELVDAFETIANQLSNLHISQ